MLHRRSRTQRGFSVSELLTVTVILGLLSTFVVLIIAPLLNAPNAQQAKIDTVQTGALALYALQRDVRQGQVNGVYVCTYPAPTTCTNPSTAPTLAAVHVVAILTARQNGNQFAKWSNTGQPNWQGFQVYWLAPDATGNGTFDLDYAFSVSGVQPGAAAASADTAVNSALQSASPTVIAHNLLTLQVDADSVSKMVGFNVQAQSTVDSKVNETSYQGDSFARN